MALSLFVSTCRIYQKIVQSLLAFVIICLSTFLKRTYMYLMNTIKFHKKILFWKTRLKIFEHCVFISVTQ